jgi:hypothetical protein
LPEQSCLIVQHIDNSIKSTPAREKLINSIYGSFEGRAALVAGFSRKGITYIKCTHKKRTKEVSKKELINRNKFGMDCFNSN